MFIKHDRSRCPNCKQIEGIFRKDYIHVEEGQNVMVSIPNYFFICVNQECNWFMKIEVNKEKYFHEIKEVVIWRRIDTYEQSYSRFLGSK